MNELSEYEKLRLRNIEYNRSVLRSLEIPGLVSNLVQCVFCMLQVDHTKSPLANLSRPEAPCLDHLLSFVDYLTLSLIPLDLGQSNFSRVIGPDSCRLVRRIDNTG